jgi:chromosome segregation ATPase
LEFLNKLKKLWFPSAETKIHLAKISEVHIATLTAKNGVLNEYKAERKTTEKALREVEIVFQDHSVRLSNLKNCFEDRKDLYDALSKLISESKSMQSDLDSAYQKLKKNKASKDDFYDWSNRQKSVWNGFSGRGGQKVRSDFNPKSIFNKYSRGDLDRYKANIESAKSTIGRIKSRRDSISSKIDSVKSDIGDAKQLCAYVKTPNGKDEKKGLKQKIASLSNQISQLKSVLDSQNAKIADQILSIKLTKTEWRDEKRKIKLSQ